MPFISAVGLMPLLLAASSAWAATGYELKLSPKPLPAALVDLAITTGISIGGADPSLCQAKARAISGRFTPHQALKALLAGSACDAQRIDDSTYRLIIRVSNVKSQIRRARPVPPSPVIVDENDVEVVVVRHEQRAGKLPAAVSVVTPPLLSGNDTDLSTIAAHIPGMAITNLGPGRDKILLRGLSDSVLTGRTQSTVGLYLDDTPITYNAPDPDLLLVDMARIEVLKGPQGNLYGQGALSGVVRLVSQRPRFNVFEGEIGIALGATQYGQGSGRITSILNMPLINDKLAFRAAIYQEKTGGYIKGNGDSATESMEAEQNLMLAATNATERTGGRLALSWQAASDTFIQATYTAQDLRSSNSQYVMGRRKPYLRVQPLAEPHDNLFQNFSLGVTKSLNFGALKISVNRLQHVVHSGYDAQPIGRFVSVPNSGILYYNEDQVFHLSSLDASLVSPQESRRVRWLAGVFLARSDEVFKPHLIDFYTKRTLYNEVRRDRINDVALFGKVTYDIAAHWSLSAGLRAQKSTHETDSSISDVHLINYLPQGRIADEITATPVSHELVVSYNPFEQLLLYAVSSNGFRTGGFNTSTLIKTAVPQAYKGDKLDNREVGLKYQTLDHQWRLNVSIFNVNWYNIQSDQLRATGLPVTLNIGDGSNNGVEIDALWHPGNRLSFQFTGQYNEPKLNRVNRQFPKITRGSMPYIARSSASLNAQWTQAVAGRYFHHSAMLSYRGRSPLNYPITNPTIMPGYTNLDLSSSLDVGRYTVSARVTNATDVRSNNFAYGNPFATNNQITPLRPRSFWLSLTGRF